MEVEASLCLGTLCVATNGVTPSRKKKKSGIGQSVRQLSIGAGHSVQSGNVHLAEAWGKPTNIYTVWYFCYQRNVIEYILLKITENVISVDTYYISTNWRTAVLSETRPAAGLHGDPSAVVLGGVNGGGEGYRGWCMRSSGRPEVPCWAGRGHKLPVACGGPSTFVATVARICRTFFSSWAGTCFCYQLHRPISPSPKTPLNGGREQSVAMREWKISNDDPNAQVKKNYTVIQL